MHSYFIGIMCGTSLDSLDVSLCHFGNSDNVKIFKSYKIRDELRNIINKSKKNPGNKKLVNQVDHEVTEFIILTLNKFMRNHNKKISAIGYPGITLKHDPNKQVSKTLGDCQKISKALKIPVVGDFRKTDMDLGGQGAPLAPYFHDYLSPNKDNFINILNLGGFANFTYMSENKLRAFDTGPANYLIDELMKKLFNKPFDKSGKMAKEGKENNDAILKLLSNKYFDLPPPKSTGFETFNLAWFQKALKIFNIKNKKNLITIATKLSIITISDAINKCQLDSKNIFFSGGGSRNLFMKKEILSRTGLSEIKKLPMGVDYKNMESVSFAWLAKMRINRKLIKNIQVTGTKKARYLGVIFR